jgi:predicted DNA repair protein MutK
MTGGFFAILDDISMLLDDAAMVTKASIKQTAPILGDDLAVNAQKSAGFHASRELPVLWQITKGSFKNKMIILPLAFILSAIAPWLITPILIMGGLYLAFEGAEKIHEYIQHKYYHVKKQKEKKLTEEQKIKSAILTDFILSIEIVVIALGTVANETFSVQIIAVTIVAIAATIGVYGIVALLVRMDDIGFYLIQTSPEDTLKDRFGELLVASLPKVIKFLTVVGTIAMILVAGGIFTHNIEYIHHIHNEYFHLLPQFIFDFILGIIIGYIVFVIEQTVIHIKKD